MCVRNRGLWVKEENKGFPRKKSLCIRDLTANKIISLVSVCTILYVHTLTKQENWAFKLRSGSRPAHLKIQVNTDARTHTPGFAFRDEKVTNTFFCYTMNTIELYSLKNRNRSSAT